MRVFCYLAVLVLFSTGCSFPERQRKISDPDGAIADLNRQIDEFNAKRPGDLGIVPITQRVSRINYVPKRAAVNCFDAKGALFLILTRQTDGRFKGSLKTDYHELPKPEGHSWGQVIAEFALPQGLVR